MNNNPTEEPDIPRLHGAKEHEVADFRCAHILIWPRNHKQVSAKCKYLCLLGHDLGPIHLARIGRADEPNATAEKRSATRPDGFETGNLAME
jgi:hypothetical protein